MGLVEVMTPAQSVPARDVGPLPVYEGDVILADRHQDFPSVSRCLGRTQERPPLHDSGEQCANMHPQTGEIPDLVCC
jgi:hypothetical protein